jgi:hypothetical protein
MLTPTNSPFCSAGPTESIVFPSTMPRAIARMIHTTRKRSRKDRPLRGGRSGSPKRNSQHMYLESLLERMGIVPGVPEGLSSAFVVPMVFSSSTSLGANAERSIVSIVDLLAYVLRVRNVVVHTPRLALLSLYLFVMVDLVSQSDVASDIP